MTRAVAVLAMLAMTGASASAQEPEARVRAEFTRPDGAFVGQRLTLRIDLLSSTGFAGTPRFEIPDLPRVVVAKVANPVIGSERVDGDTWSVVTHDFELFSQRAGDIVVPSFPVFLKVTSVDRRQSFERELRVDELRTTARTPPGADGVAWLVSGRDLSVDVRWQPQPSDDAVVGDAFVRSITIRADEVLGMALPPIPAPDRPGLAVHAERPAIVDRTERGEFTGERTERTTFVCEAPGRVEVPGATIRWFDLDADRLATAEVPAIAWSVAAAPVTDAAEAPVESRTGLVWLGAIAVVLAALVFGFRRRLAASWRAWRARRAETESAYFRRALAACRSNDARTALRETLRWLDRATPGSRSPRLSDFCVRTPELEPAIAELEDRALDGRDWNGAPFATALRRARSAPVPTARRDGALPPLNPMV